MRVASTPPNLQVKLIMTSAEHLSPTGIFLIKKCFLTGIWLFICCILLQVAHCCGKENEHLYTSPDNKHSDFIVISHP